MQLSFRLDKRPGESHLALDGKKRTNLEPNGTSLCMEELGDGFSFVFVVCGTTLLRRRVTELSNCVVWLKSEL